MKNMEESQQSQRELQKGHTINTGASDHVFKPKNKRGKKQQNRNFHEEEFQRLVLITSTSFLQLSGFTT